MQHGHFWSLSQAMFTHVGPNRANVGRIGPNSSRSQLDLARVRPSRYAFTASGTTFCPPKATEPALRRHIANGTTHPAHHSRRARSQWDRVLTYRAKQHPTQQRESAGGLWAMSVLEVILPRTVPFPVDASGAPRCGSGFRVLVAHRQLCAHNYTVSSMVNWQRLAKAGCARARRFRLALRRTHCRTPLVLGLARGPRPNLVCVRRKYDVSRQTGFGSANLMAGLTEFGLCVARGSTISGLRSTRCALSLTSFLQRSSNCQTTSVLSS